MVLDFKFDLTLSGCQSRRWPGDASGRLRLEWGPGNHPAELKWAPQSVMAAALGAAFTPSRLADTSVNSFIIGGAIIARSLASFTLDSEATPLSLSGLESRWPALTECAAAPPPRRRRS